MEKLQSGLAREDISGLGATGIALACHCPQGDTPVSLLGVASLQM